MNLFKLLFLKLKIVKYQIKNLKTYSVWTQNLEFSQRWLGLKKSTFHLQSAKPPLAV